MAFHFGASSSQPLKLYLHYALYLMMMALVYMYIYILGNILSIYILYYNCELYLRFKCVILHNINLVFFWAGYTVLALWIQQYYDIFSWRKFSFCVMCVQDTDITLKKMRIGRYIAETFFQRTLEPRPQGI